MKTVDILHELSIDRLRSHERLYGSSEHLRSYMTITVTDILGMTQGKGAPKKSDGPLGPNIFLLHFSITGLRNTSSVKRIFGASNSFRRLCLLSSQSDEILRLNLHLSLEVAMSCHASPFSDLIYIVPSVKLVH